MKTRLFLTPAAIVQVGRKLKEAAIYSTCVNVVNCTFQPLCSKTVLTVAMMRHCVRSEFNNHLAVRKWNELFFLTPKLVYCISEFGREKCHTFDICLMVCFKLLTGHKYLVVPCRNENDSYPMPWFTFLN